MSNADHNFEQTPGRNSQLSSQDQILELVGMQTEIYRQPTETTYIPEINAIYTDLTLNIRLLQAKPFTLSSVLVVQTNFSQIQNRLQQLVNTNSNWRRGLRNLLSKGNSASTSDPEVSFGWSSQQL